MSNKKTYKVSHHANMRMKERTPFNHKERRHLFREALMYGKNAYDIKDPRLHGYMLSKKKRAYVKLYKGYIFIYSKNTKHLYTVYPLPEHLRGDDTTSTDIGGDEHELDT